MVRFTRVFILCLVFYFDQFIIINLRHNFHLSYFLFNLHALRPVQSTLVYEVLSLDVAFLRMSISGVQVLTRHRGLVSVTRPKFLFIRHSFRYSQRCGHSELRLLLCVFMERSVENLPKSRPM